MGWKIRKGGRYYYLAERGIDGRPRRVYLGAGPEAVAAATRVAGRQAARAQDRADAHRDDERHRTAIAPLLTLVERSTVLVTRLMTAAGYHRHDRGPWRKRRMTAPTPETEPVDYPPDVKEACERAANGDPTAVPAVRAAFDRFPSLLAEFGDLARVAEDFLVGVLAGDNLLRAEAASRYPRDRRAALFAECESEVERVVAERVVLCETEVRVAVAQAAKLAWSEGSRVSAAADKRVDQAHARLLAATRALADVRRALRPARSPLDLLTGGTPEGPVGRNRVAGRVSAAGGTR